MNILHLSDIHFGRDKSNSTDHFERKSEILDKLINTLGTLDEDMKPDLVLVTGDIAWTGKISEFDEAYEWFRRLKTALNLGDGSFIFCPGNHDLNRSTAMNFREEVLWKQESGKKKLNIALCDELYKYENAHRLETRFHNYNVFCEKMGMQPYSYTLEDGSMEYSYLVGSSAFSFGSNSFVISCFNTAYLPYGKVLHDDQMFLGLPQIEKMIADGFLSDSADNVYRIALFHHADRYLHPNEQCEYDGRKASLPLLMKNIDLALCGHTETGGMPLLRTFGNGGSLLSGGAAYYNDDHPNSFSLLQVNKGHKPQVCSYYFDGNEWTCFASEEKISWEKQNGTIAWRNYIHHHPKFSFAIQIDEHITEIYSGYFTTRVLGVQDGFNVFYDNFINPARALDVFVDNNGIGDTPHRIGIRNAPGMWHTMEAQILIAEYHSFIKDHIEGAVSAIHGLMNADGKWLLQTPLNVQALAQQYKHHVSNVEWYKMVQQVEDYYEVLFLFPELRAPTSDEEQAISCLREIMEHGDANWLYSDIDESWFGAQEKRHFQVILQSARNGEKIGFHYERKLRFSLFGTEIDFRECDIYCIGAQPKNPTDIIKKIRTWESGDLRCAEMNYPNGMDLWICPKHLAKEGKNNPAKGAVIFNMPSEAEVPLPDSLKQFFSEYK